MPSNQIGGINFFSITPVSTAPGEVVEDVTRPGVDGKAFRKTGQRADSQRLRASIDVADNATRKAVVDAASALRGTVVTFYDAFGLDHPKLLVIDARESHTEPMLNPTGGISGVNGRQFLHVDFEIVDTRRSATET